MLEQYITVVNTTAPPTGRSAIAYHHAIFDRLLEIFLTSVARNRNNIFFTIPLSSHLNRHSKHCWEQLLQIGGRGFALVELLPALNNFLSFLMSKEYPPDLPRDSEEPLLNQKNEQSPQPIDHESSSQASP